MYIYIYIYTYIIMIYIYTILYIYIFIYTIIYTHMSPVHVDCTPSMMLFHLLQLDITFYVSIRFPKAPCGLPLSALSLLPAAPAGGLPSLAEESSRDAQGLGSKCSTNCSSRWNIIYIYICTYIYIYLFIYFCIYTWIMSDLSMSQTNPWKGEPAGTKDTYA